MRGLMPTVESVDREYARSDEAYDRDRQEKVDMENTPAEIYANVRNKARADALQDALIAVQAEPNVYAAAAAIRALIAKVPQ